MKEKYFVLFNTVDEDGSTNQCLKKFVGKGTLEQIQEDCVSFLSQTDEAYVDKYGFIHEVYEGLDQIFVFYFEVNDNDWYEIVGTMGQLLDDDDIDETIRRSCEIVYNSCLPIAEGKAQAPID